MAQAMSPEQLATTPAGKPPPGVIPNHTNPPTSASDLIAVGAVLVALMLASVAARIYTKVTILRKWTPDDYTCILAAIGGILYYITDVFAVTAGHYGTHMWDLTLANLSENGFLISSFFTNWPFFLYIAFAKTTFFLLYLQIFSLLRWLRYCSYAGIAVTTVFYTGVIIFTLVVTTPGPGQSWQKAATGPGIEKALNATVGLACAGLAIDMYIFILPIAAVQQTGLSRKRRIGVIAVFMTGGIACIASSLAIYYKWKLDYQDSADVTYEAMPVLLTGLTEICVGVIASCMPSMTGLLRRIPKGWSRLSSVFMSRFLSSRYASSRAKGSHPSDHSSSLSFKPKRKRYRDLAYVSRASFELEQPRTKRVQTYIRPGEPEEVNGDNVHLRYDIEQQSSSSTGDRHL